MNTTSAINQRSADGVKWLHPVTWMLLGIIFFVLWFVCAAFWALFAWSSVAYESRNYMLSDYFRASGFDITVDHPVNIGNDIQGARGSVDGNVSMFFGTGGGSISGEFSPSTSVKMLLPLKDGSSFLVTIPANQITYHTKGVKQASISFEFEDYIHGETSLNHTYPEGETFMNFSKPVLAESQPSVKDTNEWAQFTASTLDVQLLKYVERIDLYLTDAQLNRILN